MTDKIMIAGKDCTNCLTVTHCINNDLICRRRYYEIIQQLQAEKQKVEEYRLGWLECDKERVLQEANAQFRKRVIDKYKQALEEIKGIAKNIVIIGGYEQDKNINSCKVCPNQELDVDVLVCDLDCRKGQTMLANQILKQCEGLDD